MRGEKETPISLDLSNITSLMRAEFESNNKAGEKRTDVPTYLL